MAEDEGVRHLPGIMPLDARRREQSRQRMEKELEDQLRQEKRPVTSKRMDIEEPRVISKEDLLHCGHMVRHIVPGIRVDGTLERRAREVEERGAQLAESVKKLQEENSSLRRRLEELEASATQSKQPKGKGIGKKSAKPAPAPAPAPTIPVPVAGPSSAPPQVIAGPSSATAAVTPTTAPTARKTARRTVHLKEEGARPQNKKGGKKGQAVQPAPEPRPLPPACVNGYAVGSGGQEVKERKPATAQAANAQPPQPTRRAEPKLRPPRSAAVIISLTPSAVAKELSYKQSTDGRPGELTSPALISAG
ncbi:transcriptional regulatory protein AlgP-like [Manduca sexta]|uniref:transcriptional regulatory protein AlgP-like n=1 Tax=Manduca sexta TaxID=7130 RepID=UPI00188E2C46|nr:transcriptional regulatory protein AlgP-like [Manduca sexta]